MSLKEAIQINSGGLLMTDLLEMLEKYENGRQAMNHTLSRGDFRTACQQAGLVDALTLELAALAPD